MTLFPFAELLAAHQDTVQAVDRALVPSEASPDLASLRGQLRQRLDQLHAALSPPLSAEVAIEVLVPLVFFLDEYVLKRIAARTPPETCAVLHWSLLQRDLFPEGDGAGGDVFFERATMLLSADKPDPVVLQAYLVCLSAGFVGRHFDDPTVLQTIRQRLAECLPKPPRGGDTTVSTCRPTPRFRPAWNHWCLAGSMLVFAQLLLSMVAWLL